MKEKIIALWNRYTGMRGLMIYSILLIILCIYDIFEIIKFIQKNNPDFPLIGAYACNTVCILFISIQVLRLNTKKLLTLKTAKIIINCGAAILFTMCMRNIFLRRATMFDTLSKELNYQDWHIIAILALLLVVLGQVILDAAKIKEENDLTI